MVDLSEEALLDYHEMVSKTFRSEKEGYEFYNNYAFDRGFSVRRCYVERDTTTKEICLRKFVCSRQGFRDAKHMNKAIKKRKSRNLSRCGCAAKMVIKLNKETRQWYVKDLIDEHNHPLASPDLVCLLRSHRGISNEQKADIIEMEIAGVRKHQIMNILEMQYGGYDKVGCTSRDLYNFCYRYKIKAIERGDAETVIRHFKHRRESNPDSFFRYVLDEEGHLKHFFWSDTQSRLDYEAFSDVLVFYNTYQTNRYNLPFVPFVGLNHHRSTVVFGCGLISHETSESYEWLLQTFLAGMAQKHPVSVITDGDLAMQKAIRTILPYSNHRLCTWHIEQNILRNLKNSKISTEFRKFLYDRCSIEEVERKWVNFLYKNKISSKHEWLYQMYQMRRLWCAAYQVARCFLGLRSNQRSESLNSKLHKNLDRKMTLFDMYEHYEHCLANLRRNEAYLDAPATQSVSFTEKLADPMEKHAASVFTPKVFELVKEKMDSTGNYVIWAIQDGCDITTYDIIVKNTREWKFQVDCESDDDSIISMIRCSCRKMERDGIPCAHIFCVLKELRPETIPSYCVLSRWSMKAKAGFPPIRKSSMYDTSQSLEKYRELRNLSREAAFKASLSNESVFLYMKRVLCEIVGSGDASNAQVKIVSCGPMLAQTSHAELPNEDMVLDPVVVKSKGAPKKDKRIEVFQKKPREVTCSQCKQKGHNRRTCSELKELEMNDQMLK